MRLQIANLETQANKRLRILDLSCVLLLGAKTNSILEKETKNHETEFYIPNTSNKILTNFDKYV